MKQPNPQQAQWLERGERLGRFMARCAVQVGHALDRIGEACAHLAADRYLLTGRSHSRT